MFETVYQHTIPDDRRRAIGEELDRGYLLTDILILPDRLMSTAALEVITGTVVEGGRPRVEQMLRRGETFTLRTCSGEPLGEMKLGMDPSKRWTSREQRTRAMAGEHAEIRRVFPARFAVDAETAAHLLRSRGYGIARPRYFCRAAMHREIRDSHGGVVKARDNWLLVEEGSRFEMLARKNGDLKPLADGAETQARRKAS